MLVTAFHWSEKYKYLWYSTFLERKDWFYYYYYEPSLYLNYKNLHEVGWSLDTSCAPTPFWIQKLILWKIKTPLLALFEWLMAIDLIRESVSKASASNSPNVEKANGMNLYPLSSHLDAYFLFFFSTARLPQEPMKSPQYPQMKRYQSHLSMHHYLEAN